MLEAEGYVKELENEIDDCRTVLRHYAEVIVETLNRYEPTRFNPRKEGARDLKESLRTTGMSDGEYSFHGDNTGATFRLNKGKEYHQTWLWIYDELAIWALQKQAKFAAEKEEANED